MSVYLKDDMVLLDSDMVATDAMCCCGGACCIGSDCSITANETDCTDMGGTYQGDGTPCDPNPCMVDCACGFEAFDGSGSRFLRYEAVGVGTYNFQQFGVGGYTAVAAYNLHIVQEYDPDTCELTTDTSDVSSSHSNTIPGTTPCVSLVDESCWTSLGTACVCCGGGTGAIPVITTTPTTQTTHSSCTHTDMTCHCDGDDLLTETLSMECNPTMGVFDSPFFKNN